MSTRRSRRRRVLAFALLALGLGLAGPAGRAQPFTRVTDPANPVVSDAGRSGGGVWADFDRDGDLDLFVANGNQAGQNDALYLGDGAGGFAAVTSGPVVTDGGASIGGTAADYDGDGWLDLLVANRALANGTPTPNFLYRGAPGGAFTRVLDGPIGTDVSNTNSASWVDADADGDLDLFLTNFLQAAFFYRNDGGALVRAAVPGLTTSVSPSIIGAWADFDDDGDPDYFRGNGAGQPDTLFVNGGGLAFSPVGLGDTFDTLGASWGDFDDDGDLDLVAAGFSNHPERLYVNGGAPGWALAPTPSAPLTTDGGSSVGTAWGDYDHDGDLDLFVANFNQAGALYENGGPPAYAFTRVTTGAPAAVGASFGAAWADYDGDGDLDLFVANQNNEADFLYRNDCPPGAGHWLALDLRGAAPNTAAVGARVRVTARIGGAVRTLRRDVLPQTGYNSQTLRLHVGLGDATTADEVRVEWPGGAVDVLRGVAADQRLTIEEGQTTPAERGPGGSGLRLDAPGPNPAHGAAALRFTLPLPGRVRLAVYDPLGREVAVLADGDRAAGRHDARFDAAGRAGGVYVARLAYAGDVAVRLLVLSR